MRCFRLTGLIALLIATVALPSALPAKPAGAQATKSPEVPPTRPASVPANASGPLPQQTTATFGDWTLRCARTAAAAQTCEVVQGINSGDHLVAQIALGHPSKGQPMRMVMLVPTSVSFAAAPALSAARDGDTPLLSLVWRRCLPSGCMADGEVSIELITRLRGWSDAGKLTFQDGNGQAIALPVSPKGLTAALDALAKGDGA